MTMRKLTLAGVLMAALAMLAAEVWAQSTLYRERPSPYKRDSYGDAGGGREDKAGVFDYYVLALSWSPTYCASRRDNRPEPQCDRREGRPYSFVLHGLWPQYQRGWPQHCQSSDRGFVPRPVANRMLDIMPSDKLIFNEYRKHGTCSGLGVDGYFDLARKLHDKVKIPRRFIGLTDDRMTIAPGELVREFMAANPQLKPDMIAVQCGGPGNRLREVRVCFEKSGEFRACGHNEDQRKLCSADRMYVPPVRSGGGGANPDSLPGPREERKL